MKISQNQHLAKVVRHPSDHRPHTLRLFLIRMDFARPDIRRGSQFEAAAARFPIGAHHLVRRNLSPAGTASCVA